MRYAPDRLFLLLLAANGRAQWQDERLRADQLLSSASLREQTWRVYLAGHLHDDALNRQLVARLAEADQYKDAEPLSEQEAYVFGLFEALIESRQSVPADLLEPFAARWRDPVIMLLANSQVSDDKLLAMRKEHLRDAVACHRQSAARAALAAVLR